MSFLRIDDSHLNVPGKMDVDEMACLAALAAQVPKGGRIVEVGPFYGRSTRVMAQANPGARITSIDTFEDVEWTRRYAAQHRDIPPFGIDAFARYTADLPQVSSLAGPSPDVARDWDAPIDMYFEDAVHGGPVLAENIAFWTGHLRPGGIACGHDYTLRFPDIKRAVDALAAEWGTRAALVGSLWALRKPLPGAVPAPALTLPLSRTPRLTLHAKTKRGGLHRALDGYWCGAHLEADRMLWLQTAAPDLPPGLALEYRVGHPVHGTGPWTPAGSRARLGPASGKPLAFDRVAFRLTGANPDGLLIGYRVSARRIGGGGSAVSGTSERAFGGAWARVDRAPGLAVNAVCAAVYTAAPPDAQAAFPPARTALRGQKILRRLVQGAARSGRDNW